MLFACLCTRLCFLHIGPDCSAWTCFASKKEIYIPFSVNESEDSFSPLHRMFCCSYSTSPMQPRRHPRLRFIVSNNITLRKASANTMPFPPPLKRGALVQYLSVQDPIYKVKSSLLRRGSFWGVEFFFLDIQILNSSYKSI